MRCRLAAEVDLVTLQNPAWNWGQSVAGLTWNLNPQQKITEDNDAADSDVNYNGVVTSADVGKSTEVVHEENGQDNGNQEINIVSEVMDANDDQCGNASGIGNSQGTSKSTDAVSESPIRLQNEVNELRMSSTAGGSGSYDVEDERFDEQETISQMMFAEEPNWLGLMDCSSEDSSMFSGAAVPVANVDGDGVTPATNLVTDQAVHEENGEDNSHQEIDIVSEVIDANDDQCDNACGIDNPQGTSTSTEAASPIQLQNEVNELRMLSTAIGSDCGIDDERFEDQETISQMIIAEEDIWQRSLELERDSSEEQGDTSISNGGSGSGDVVQKGVISQMIIADDEIIEFSMAKYNENDEQVNTEGNDEQGTSDDCLVPPILEAVALIQFPDDDIEYEMPSLTEENGRDVVNQKGAIPLRIKTKTGKCQGEVEDGRDYLDEGSEKSAKEQKRRSPRNKFPTCTATKTKSYLKPSVSVKGRIPSAKKKRAVKSKPQWKCPHCAKICISKSQLARHIRSHTGERPFSCPHCPKAMAQAGHLKDHIGKRHPKETQNFLSCEICPMKFPFPCSLKAHMKIHDGKNNHLKTHTATAEVIFKCPHCNCHYERESRLKSHISRKHPDGCKTDGQSRCSFCSYTTKYSGNLVRHVRIHTGEKPFNCPHCSYAANQKVALNKHLKTHH